MMPRWRNYPGDHYRRDPYPRDPYQLRDPYLRDAYQLRDPYLRDAYQLRDPSLWKMVTILAVILILASMGRVPQPTPVYKRSASLPLPPLLVIPVALFVLGQWLSETTWHPAFLPGRVHPSSSSFGRSSWYPEESRQFFNPRDPRMPMLGWQQQQRWGWPWMSRPPPGYGGHWDPHNRYMQSVYDQNQNRGIWNSFLDYGGHWLFIFLGIALFAFMGAV